MMCEYCRKTVEVPCQDMIDIITGACGGLQNCYEVLASFADMKLNLDYVKRVYQVSDKVG